MSDVIDELLARDDVETDDPASRADINAVARQFDAPLPELLVELWREIDGVTIESLDARIPGPREVVRMLREERSEQDLVERGLLPVLDDREGNCLAVALRDPMAFRVLHLPHDDGSRLVFRDFESCLRALMDAADAGETADLFLAGTDGDYAPDAPRDEEDREAAKLILARPHARGNEWNHAVRLLDGSDVDAFAKLLETDHFVRRDVRERMAKMRAPAIRELLRQDGEAFEAFVVKFTDVLRDAGLHVGERNDRCVRVGEVWYDVEAFFHRRHIPDAVPRMVRWIEDQRAGRDPNERPGNFMSGD